MLDEISSQLPGTEGEKRVESSEREGVFANARSIIGLGIKAVEEAFPEKQRGDGSTLDNLDELSDLVDDIELHPEAYSYIEFPPSQKTDKFGQLRQIESYRLFGPGDLGLEVRFEQFADYDKVRQNLVSQVVIAVETINKIIHNAGFSSVPDDKANAMFEYSEMLGDRAKRIAMKWVRQISLTVIENGREKVGVNFVDAPGGLGVGVRDMTDIKALVDNHGFLLPAPKKIETPFTFDEVRMGLKTFKGKRKEIVNNFSSPQ